MASNPTLEHALPGQDTVSGLFGRLINDASALFRSEIALAKSELSEAATNAKLGIAALATAFVVLLAGAQALIAALILGLAEVMRPWAAAAIVGAILAAVGFVMVATAKRKLSLTTASKTQESLLRDAELIARRT